jgi:hypothetical protein
VNVWVVGDVIPIVIDDDLILCVIHIVRCASLNVCDLPGRTSLINYLIYPMVWVGVADQNVPKAKCVSLFLSIGTKKPHCWG